MLVVVVLLATVLLRVAIVTAVVYLLLPQGALCPHCNVEMVAVRNRVLDRLVPVLQRRWCVECGAHTAGLPSRRRPLAPPPASPADLCKQSRIGVPGLRARARRHVRPVRAHPGRARPLRARRTGARRGRTPQSIDVISRAARS